MTAKEKRALLREARNLGFKDDFKDRDVTQLCCVYALVRRLDLQIWADGKHRVAHAIATPSGWRWTTAPTPFIDLCGMYRAIAFEWSRPEGRP